MARNYGRLRPRRGYHRGGRAGTHQPEYQCNIPEHRLVREPRRQEELLSEDLAIRAMGNVPVDRMLQADARSLHRRRALALLLGAATVGVATRALSRSRAGQRVRPRPVRLPRFPKVVGIPRSRPVTTAGIRGRGGGGSGRFFQQRLFRGQFRRR